VDPFVAVESIVETLDALEGMTMVADSEKKDTLNVAESPFGYRLEANVKDHILVAKKFFYPVVKTAK
jgi:hypothetical protein